MPMNQLTTPKLYVNTFRAWTLDGLYPQFSKCTIQETFHSFFIVFTKIVFEVHPILVRCHYLKIIVVFPKQKVPSIWKKRRKIHVNLSQSSHPYKKYSNFINTTYFQVSFLKHTSDFLIFVFFFFTKHYLQALDSLTFYIFCSSRNEILTLSFDSQEKNKVIVLSL